MTTSDSGRLGRFVASMGAFVFCFVIGPVLALAVSRLRFSSANPVHGVPAPWNLNIVAARDALRDPLTDGTVVDLIVRTCLVVTWTSMVLVAITTVMETVHLVRHRGMSLPSIRGLNWAQQVARVIAAGLIVFVPLTTPRASLALSGASGSGPGSADATSPRPEMGHDPYTRMMPAPVGQAPRADPRNHTDQAELADRVHVVQRGESVYAIAQAIAESSPLTTTEVADAILDANLGTMMNGGQRFTNPAYIEVGWKLVIPQAVHPPAQVPRSPVYEEWASATTEDAAPAAPGAHLVEPGDTLSSIAAEHLGAADEWPAIWAENAGAAMTDGRTFDDPDLIVPGWRLIVPDAGELPPPPQADAEVALDGTDAPPATAAPPSPGSTPIEPSATPLPAPRSDPLPTTTPTTTAPTPATTTTTSSTPATTVTSTTPSMASSAGPGGEDVGPAPRGPSAPSPIRLEHAALLAGGILALVGLRRRQRLRSGGPRTRVPEPRQSAVATERKLRTVDAGERATRLDVAIRAAASALIDSDAQVGIAMADEDGRIELLLTADATLPAPWSGNAASWSLPASVPVELLSDAARLVGAPCVALAQLGVSERRDVLVDVEACGTLAIEAPPAIADEVVTAIAAGLASSPFAEVAHLIGVSLPPTSLLDHRNAHHAATATEALELGASVAGTTMTNDRTTFSLRSLRTGGEMWEPAVVLLVDADLGASSSCNSLLPAAGHGLAVVASVGPDVLADAPARLVADDDGWILTAFGASIPITPVGVSPDELGEIVDVLDDASTPLVDRDDELQSITVHVAADIDDAEPADFVATPHQVVVRLMGGVDVISSDGAPGRFERSKTVELIAWLATHRERPTRTGARTALWEMDVRDATFANVVSEARRALARLAPPPDDEEWLARTLNEQLPLHPAVVTDAHLVEERLAAARLQPPTQAVATLRPAAEMIRGMPFAGTSYLWPDAEGITSNLVLLATGVTTELAAHALSLGDAELLFWATGQGLRVLPGHEELIGLRMRAHAGAGDLAGVRQEWESYERVIVADAWSDGEPAPKLLALRHELLTSAS